VPAALPLPNYISQSSENTTSFKIIEAKYGNGYGQRARDGLNSNVGSWTIDYEHLLAGEYAVVIAAFDAAASVDYFTWQAPTDVVSKKWIVKEYTRRASSGDLYSISATLEQVFDL
jgi:phage-related protein